MKRLLSIFLIFVYIASLLSFEAFAANEQTTENQLMDKFMENIKNQLCTPNESLEIYSKEKASACKATMDDEFTEDEVLVVLTKEQSRKKQQYLPNDFPQIDVVSVETILDYYPESDNRINLKITLKNSDKRKVLSSVATLEKLNIVYAAQPNYFYNTLSREQPTEVFSNNSITKSAYTQEQLRLEAEANRCVSSCCAKKYQYSNLNSKIKVGFVGHPIKQNSESGAKVVKWFDCVSNTEIYNAPGAFLHTTQVANVLARNQISDMESIHQVNFCGQNSCSGIYTNVELYSFNINSTLDQQSGDTFTTNSSYYINAFNKAMTYGIKILSFSELFWKTNKTLADINFENAVASYTGILVVSASNASNGMFSVPNIDICEEKIYPTVCTSDNVIVVGNCKYDNSMNVVMDSNSCYGRNSVDLFAPGITFDTVDNANVSINGTSYSTPRVAGAAAVLLNINENLTSSQLKYYIMAGVDKQTALTGKCVSGGSLNIYKSAKMLIADMACIESNVFTGHFTDTENLQVAAMTTAGDGIMKVYVWTYDEDSQTFSDPIHWRTQREFYIECCLARNVCGDFDGNGYDEIACFYDWQDYIFIFGENFETRAGYVNLPVENFMGRLVAIDFDNDGRDEIAGIYSVEGVWGHSKIYSWDFSGSGSSLYSSMVLGHDTGPYMFEAGNISYRVAGGDFDGDGFEEMAALYDYQSDSEYSLFIYDITGRDYVGISAPIYGATDVDVSEVTGRVVACDRDGDGRDEIICMYDNSTEEDDGTISDYGIINYGFEISVTDNGWELVQLSGDITYMPRQSTYKMVSGKFSDDNKDDFAAFYTNYLSDEEYHCGEIVLFEAPNYLSYQTVWHP